MLIKSFDINLEVNLGFVGMAKRQQRRQAKGLVQQGMLLGLPGQCLRSERLLTPKVPLITPANLSLVLKQLLLCRRPRAKSTKFSCNFTGRAVNYGPLLNFL